MTKLIKESKLISLFKTLSTSAIFVISMGAANLSAQGVYTNPIASPPHADPYVLVWNGKYYFSDTNTIGKITYDTHLENVASGAGSCTINLPSGYQGGEAPEMLEWQDHAYYFYTSGYNVGIVLRSDSADPCGNYTTLTTSLFSGGWDIDMFVRADGTLWAAMHMGPIQIVQMADPVTPMTSPITIVDGTESWETGNGMVRRCKTLGRTNAV